MWLIVCSQWVSASLIFLLYFTQRELWAKVSSSIEPGFQRHGLRHAYPQILNVLTVLGVSSHRLGECQSDMRKRPASIHSRLEVENVAPIKSRSSGATEYWETAVSTLHVKWCRKTYNDHIDNSNDTGVEIWILRTGCEKQEYTDLVKSPELMKNMIILDNTTLMTGVAPSVLTLLLYSSAHISIVIPISTTQLAPKKK